MKGRGSHMTDPKVTRLKKSHTAETKVTWLKQKSHDWNKSHMTETKGEWLKQRRGIAGRKAEGKSDFFVTQAHWYVTQGNSGFSLFNSLSRRAGITFLFINVHVITNNEWKVKFLHQNWCVPCSSRENEKRGDQRVKREMKKWSKLYRVHSRWGKGATLNYWSTIKIKRNRKRKKDRGDLKSRQRGWKGGNL